MLWRDGRSTTLLFVAEMILPILLGDLFGTLERWPLIVRVEVVCVLKQVGCRPESVDSVQVVGQVAWFKCKITLA